MIIGISIGMFFSALVVAIFGSLQEYKIKKNEELFDEFFDKYFYGDTINTLEDYDDVASYQKRVKCHLLYSQFRYWKLQDHIVSEMGRSNISEKLTERAIKNKMTSIN